MPPHGVDYWNPPYILKTIDGQEIRIEPVTFLDASDDLTPRVLFAPSEFAINAFVRNRRGLMDWLCSRTWTKSYQRFIRSSKRHKEKERRKKLKENANED